MKKFKMKVILGIIILMMLALTPAMISADQSRSGWKVQWCGINYGGGVFCWVCKRTRSGVLICRLTTRN